MNSNFGKGLLWGFILGGIAGVATGVLLAPKSGREVRNTIASKINQFLDSDDSDHSYSNVLHNVENEGKRKGEALIEDAKVKAEVLLADADKLLNEIRMKSTKALTESPAA